MVKYLLGLCTQAGAGPVSDQAFESGEDTYESLSVMILKAQDGALSQRRCIEMNRWLMNDTEAVRYYIDFQQLTALLYFHFNPSRFCADTALAAGLAATD
jgi:hypothetical protein